MKVVFFEDVEGTAQVGDVKEVKGGFARNFLLPRGLAGPGSRENVQRATAIAQKEHRRQEKLDADAREVTGKLSDVALTFQVRLGDNGRLFGSVTNRDIAERLAAVGHAIDAHIIMLPEPIRDLGERPVTIRLTRNVSTDIAVNLVPDEASKAILERLEAEAKAAEEAAAKRAAEAAYAESQPRGRRRRDNDDEDQDDS